MLTGETADIFKSATGLSDEAMAQLHPGLEKLFNNRAKTSGYQIVAEVVKSEACFAQVKVGDRLVFNGVILNPQKSTGVICTRAMLPIMVQVNALLEMMPEWAESGKDELPEIVFRYVRCLDPGLENGGVGSVVYRVYVEKTTSE